MRSIIRVTFLLFALPALAQLQVQTGQFTASTSGVDTTVTASFQGKALIFSAHGKNTNSDSANADFEIGFYDGTHSRTNGWEADDAVSTTDRKSTRLNS